MANIHNLLGKIFGSKTEKDIKAVQPFVDKILEIYPSLANISNDELRERSHKLREKIQQGIQEENTRIKEIKDKIEAEKPDFDIRENLYKEIDGIEEEINNKLKGILDDLIPEAFSVMKETARRFKENEEIEVTASEFDKELASQKENVIIQGDKAIWLNHWIAGGTEITWDMVHYDVQLFGGVVLHQGKIAEMATGEGKTLVATLPVFLNALTGRGVHIVTVNDYLAKRDAEWMGPMYEFHGLSVDCIDKHQPNSPERRAAYSANITFGTNNEFGFDYLRDNMAQSPEDLVQRGHNYAIVDEVDSVLIDDARTPLIISGPVAKGDVQQFDELKPRVEKIVSAQRQLVQKIFTEARQKLNNPKDNKERDEGSLLLYRAFKGLPKYKPLIKFLSEQGVKAQMLKTEGFYMQENNKNMHIVTDPLYFVIDEKNNSIELTDKGIDLITESSEDESFFVLPDIGSEVANIEKSEEQPEIKIQRKDELIRDYAVKSERVHTVNQLLKAYTLFEKDVEYVVMENKVKIVDEQTGRIMEGRRYSDGLHQAIEAKERVKVEAATQTFATVTLQNYFRMYDKLSGMTGTAETEAGEFWDIYKLDVVVIPTNRPIVRDDREDLVYKTKREKLNAIIEEIVALIEAGRPALVGTTSVESSELISKMLKIRGFNHNVLNAKLHKKEADIVAEAGRAGTVTIATNMAGRGTDIKLSAEVKKAGGLAIIGTERHESRRVDRQLRGRSGRQGDPGSSQFFVSLEDDLMRLFSSDRIVSIMDRLGHEEGDVIQHSMISKSIERAQKKVEENNFGIRKRLLEYDDVMNSQREVIYKRRRHALHGERIGVDIVNMMYDICESITDQYHGEGDYEGFKMELIRILSLESPYNEEDFLKANTDDIVQKLYTKALDVFRRNREAIAKQAYPVIRDVYENKSHIYENIVVPITDGSRIYQIVTNLKKAYESEGEELVKSYEKSILLGLIDMSWKEHLREMDELRQSVQNAQYEQKDPLLIYKFESFNLFKSMVEKTNKDIISVLLKGRIPEASPEQVREAEKRRKTDYSRMSARKDEFQRSGGPGQPPQPKPKAQPVRVEKKVGRNEPCPCGSGKKYKNCHGKND